MLQTTYTPTWKRFTMTAAANPLEQVSDKSPTKLSSTTDGLSAYRMPGATDAKATSTPSVVEGNQLVIPPTENLYASAATTAAKPAAATTDAPATPATTAATAAAAADVPPQSVSSDPTLMAPASQRWSPIPVDVNGNALPAPGAGSPGYPDAGDVRPMWMSLADPTMMPLIQKNYGISSMNGWEAGVPVAGIDNGTGTATGTDAATGTAAGTAEGGSATGSDQSGAIPMPTAQQTAANWSQIMNGTNGAPSGGAA